MAENQEQNIPLYCKNYSGSSHFSKNNMTSSFKTNNISTVIMRIVCYFLKACGQNQGSSLVRPNDLALHVDARLLTV